MNDDLISRNAVMELIKSKIMTEGVMQGDRALIDGYGLLGEVSDLQTVCNLDKIVKQLEEKECETVLKAPDTGDLMHNAAYQKWMMKSFGFKESIEIVKARGLE